LKVIHSSKYRYDGETKYGDKKVYAFVSIVKGHGTEVVLVDNARYILEDGSSKYFESTSKKTAVVK
jgi:hypothetical protein